MKKNFTLGFFHNNNPALSKNFAFGVQKIFTYFWDKKMGYFWLKISIYENPKPDKWNPTRLEPEKKMLGSNRTEPEKKIKTRTRTEPDFLLPDTSLAI